MVVREFTNNNVTNIIKAFSATSLPFISNYLDVAWLNSGSQKALLGFEPRISCLLDRRFNQLSHGAS